MNGVKSLFFRFLTSWSDTERPVLTCTELVETVERNEVDSTCLVKILNPLFSHRGTEAQRFFHHEEMKVTKKDVKLISPSLLARLRQTLLKKRFFLKLFSEKFCLCYLCVLCGSARESFF